MKKTSLTKYAEELPNELHDAFFRGVEDEARRAAFDVNPEVMKANLGRRIFETKDGVIISAPAETVGEAVTIKTQGQQRRVNCTGVIEKERMISRGKSVKTKAAKV